MAENSSKSDQIRKLRELQMLAGKKIVADCEADAERDSSAFARKKESKANS